MTSKEWSELLILAKTDAIGEDRRDKSEALCATGIMSTAAKLDGFDPVSLLPNRPPRRELTIAEQVELLMALPKAKANG